MINLEKRTDAGTSYYVYYNGIYLGDAEQDESGFYNFYFSNENPGYWTAHSLRIIADTLDELNKEWNNYIKENLK